MKHRARWLVCSVVAGCATTPLLAQASQETRPPNIVWIVADDLGFGDLSCFGATPGRTPELDRLAAQGVRLTSFEVTSPACSPSRASILTGCYPTRVDLPGVLSPKSKAGIHHSEMTAAEVFKARGYATGCFGKWHLGSVPEALPLAQGFDAWFGIPYSHDMTPWHWHVQQGKRRANFPDLPLFDGEHVIELDPRLETLTERFTQRAVQFIDEHADEPFFLYLPYSMPHVRIAASEPFVGKTGEGLYADVIAEMDAAVGRVRAAIERHDLAEDTVVVFTSDNGPWTWFGDHGGSKGNLRGAKGTGFEGGTRVPCIIWGPGRIAPGRVEQGLVSSLDLLPSFAKWAGAELPKSPIDGIDASEFLAGSAEVSPRTLHATYWPRQLLAVRDGRYKLVFAHKTHVIKTPGSGGLAGERVTEAVEEALFDLAEDPGERVDVSAKHPEVLERLRVAAESLREELGDGLQKRRGNGVRVRGAWPDSVMQMPTESAEDRAAPMVGERFGVLPSLRPAELPGAKQPAIHHGKTLYRWWTIGCPFCRDSLPALSKLVKQHEGVRLVAVFHRKGPTMPSDEALQQVLADYGVDAELWIDPEWATLRKVMRRGELNSATSISVMTDADDRVLWTHPGPRVHPSQDGSHPTAQADFEALQRVLERPDATAPLRVMSFNIRYDSPRDGDNAWALRRDLVADTIRGFAPDLLGLQEVTGPQARWIDGQLNPTHDGFGETRTPQEPNDEQCRIYWLRERFGVRDRGTFWLSETPTVPGSKSWDAALPRIATWVRLFDHRSGRDFVLCNTHFDHVGLEARRESAKLVRRHVSEWEQQGLPTIVVGDFNAPVGGAVHQALVGADPGDAVVLQDAHGRWPEGEPAGTFHGFDGDPGGARIDWILAAGAWKSHEFGVDRTIRQDRYPSDHFPVTTVLVGVPAKR